MTVTALRKARPVNPHIHQQTLSHPLSPHFAMNTQQRIDNFQGTVSEYVAYLENKVKQLTRVNSPPSPESDTIFRYHDSDALARPAKKPRKSRPRWKNEMDKMLHDIPNAGDWSSKRETVGLSSWTDILGAFDMIIDVTMTPATPIAAVADRSIVIFEPVNAIIQLLGRYASGVAALEIQQRFTTQVVHFCKLVFVSLCYVLVQKGMETDVVDNVMRVCISKSDAKHLDVLREGAHWVNRMISALMVKGLRHRASEVFVLCE